MSLEVEQLVVDRLREWLLLKLPAKVAEVNAARAPVLTAATAGPYTLPGAGTGLYISLTGTEGPFTHCVLTGGVRSASAAASDINSAGGPIPIDFAYVDGTGRLALSKFSAGAPTSSPSIIVIGDDHSEAVNQVFGWEAGGVFVLREPLVSPGFNGVVDGAPLVPDMGAGFWVILGDNASVPIQPAVRRDENIVAVGVTIGVPVPQNNKFRQEHLRAALRCVREVLFLEANGRTLGNAAQVVLVEEKQALVKSRPIAYAEFPNQLFCRCAIELQVRVFERQA